MGRQEGEIGLGEACSRFNISPTTLGRYVSSGAVTPRKETAEGTTHGRVWFKEVEVEKAVADAPPKRRSRTPRLRKSTERATNVRGKLAAKIIPMFVARRPFSEICVLCEADPRVVQQMYEAWALGVDGLRKIRTQERIEAEKRMERRHEMQLERQQKFYEKEVKLEKERRLAEKLAEKRKTG